MDISYNPINNSMTQNGSELTMYTCTYSLNCNGLDLQISGMEVHAFMSTKLRQCDLQWTYKAFGYDVFMIVDIPLTEPDIFAAPSYDCPLHCSMLIPIFSSSLSNTALMFAPKRCKPNSFNQL